MKCQNCYNHATHRIMSNGIYLCDKCSNRIVCNTWVVSIDYYQLLHKLYYKIYLSTNK